ncbi:major facilitator superfamily domain-containing protein [Aspergillus californicus]
MSETKDMELAIKTSSRLPSFSHAELSRQFGQTSTVPSWAKYVPGPSPQHLFKRLPTSICRVGVMLVGCWIFLISGTNLSMMGSLSSVPGYLKEIKLDNGSSKSQLLIGTVNSIYYVGVLGGALFCGWFSDRVGRRRAVVAAGICGLFIIPLLAATQNFAWVLVLRLMNGLFTGLFDAVGLNWCAETVEAKHRGLAIGIQLACAASGAGSLAEARETLTLLYPAQSDEDNSSGSAYVESSLVTIQRSMDAELEQEASSTYWKMFTKKDSLHTARRTWSALLIQFGTQAMVGVGVVTGYGIRILETGGWDAETAALLMGSGIFVQAIFGVLGATLADRIGRRRAMVYGAFVGAALLILIGMCGYFVGLSSVSDPPRSKAFGAAIVALLLTWCAVFGLTWLWCPFIYPAEIFPAVSRSRGSSVGITGHACGAFLINMVSPYLFDAIGHNAMFLFGGLSFLLGVLCYLWMPETARKSLEEISALYDEGAEPPK